ncbi:hypothetical protein LSAT2_023798 [Lamellibrachia satsuma]|nr:hypothetical protein LSAT2_023798 [Lamellibrachia satsuma]
MAKELRRQARWQEEKSSGFDGGAMEGGSSGFDEGAREGGSSGFDGGAKIKPVLDQYSMPVFAQYWASTVPVLAQYSMPVLAQLTASVQNCTGPMEPPSGSKCAPAGPSLGNGSNK